MRAAAAFVFTVAFASAAGAQTPRLPIPVRGLGAEPTAAEREFSAGDALLQRGDFAGAQARFEAARRLDPRDARPVFYLGEVAFRQARFADAEAQFRAAIQLRATMAEAHAELGATLRELGRLPDAVASLRTALRLAPTLGEAQLTLAMCLEDQGDIDGALTAYRAATRALREGATAPLNLGLLLAGRAPGEGTPERAEALQSLREAVRRGDRDAAVLASAGPALRRLGDAQGAVRALDRARTLSATPSASVLAELAQAHYAAGQGTLAEARITDAIRAAPTDASLHYVHGLLRAAAQDRAGAVSAFRDVIRLAPTGEQAARARARITALAPR